MLNKQQAPTPVRLPEDLKTWLKVRAEENFRSVNAEVIAILMAARKQEEKRAAKN